MLNYYNPQRLKIPDDINSKIKSSIQLVKHLDLSSFLLDRATLIFKPKKEKFEYTVAEKIELERTCDGFNVIQILHKNHLVTQKPLKISEECELRSKNFIECIVNHESIPHYVTVILNGVYELRRSNHHKMVSENSFYYPDSFRTTALNLFNEKMNKNGGQSSHDYDYVFSCFRVTFKHTRPPLHMFRVWEHFF